MVFLRFNTLILNTTCLTIFHLFQGIRAHAPVQPLCHQSNATHDRLQFGVNRQQKKSLFRGVSGDKAPRKKWFGVATFAVKVRRATISWGMNMKNSPKKTFQMWYRNIEIISKQSSNVLIVLFAIHFFKIWQSLSRTTRFKRSDHRWHRQHNDRWNDEYVFRFSHTNW